MNTPSQLEHARLRAAPSRSLFALLDEVRRGLVHALLLQIAVAGATLLLCVVLLGVLLTSLGLSDALVGMAELAGVLLAIGALIWLGLRNPVVRRRDPVQLAAWLDRALAQLRAHTRVRPRARRLPALPRRLQPAARWLQAHAPAGPLARLATQLTTHAPPNHADGRPEAPPPNPQLAESAVRLSHERGQHGGSEALADEAIVQAHEALRAAQPLRAVNEARRRVFAGWVVALVLAGLTLVSIASVAPHALHHALKAPAVLLREGPKLRPELPLLRLGDIRVSYRYPAYAERAPVSAISPGGLVQALPGTEVTLETSSMEALAQVMLQLDFGPEDKRELSVQVEGRKLRARFQLQRGGSYRFLGQTASGGKRQQRPVARLELEADEAPVVQLRSPKKSPIELNRQDKLHLSFTAKDDFRLGATTLRWSVIGSPREGRLELPVRSAGQRKFKGEVSVPLKQLNLRPGDRVAYTLEVADNDDVNGPKLGASRTMELRVYSKQAHHAAVLALEEEALDALIELLGDNLEGRFEWVKAAAYGPQLKATDALLQRAEEAAATFAQAVTAAKGDPAGDPALAQAFQRARAELVGDTRNLRRVLFSATRQFKHRGQPNRLRTARVKTQQGQWIANLEETAVYLADLLNDQRLKDAQSLTRELRAQQQALREALERYQAAPTPEERALLAETIKQLREKVAEISAQLSKLRASIPPDFVNPDAIAAQPPEQLDRLQRMIEDGDLEGAMLALDQMLGATEQSLAALQEGRRELGNREYSEIQAQAKQLQQDLDRVEREQRDLARRTEGVSRDLMKRMKSRLGEPEAFVQRQKQRLERAAKAMDAAEQPAYGLQRDAIERTQRRLKDSLRAMRAKDFGATQDVLQQAEQLLDSLRKDAQDDPAPGRDKPNSLGERVDRATPEVKAVLKDLQELMPDPGKLLNAEERERLRRYQGQQEALREQTKKLGEQLTKLDEQLPIVGPKGPTAIQQAQDAMRGARDQLKRGDAPGALKDQRGALEALAGLRSQLQQLGPPEGAQAAPGGVPLPFGQRGGQGKRGGGAPGSSSYQKVEIPKPERFQAPEAFRRDILEAAKQGTAKDYEDAVRRYYEELVR